MTEQERAEFEAFKALGLTPRQIRTIIKESTELKEYIEFLEEL